MIKRLSGVGERNTRISTTDKLLNVYVDCVSIFLTMKVIEGLDVVIVRPMWLDRAGTNSPPQEAQARWRSRAALAAANLRSSRARVRHRCEQYRTPTLPVAAGLRPERLLTLRTSRRIGALG
jgi:hypothetical protein